MTTLDGEVAVQDPKVNPFLQAALQYAKIGWLVFPLVPGDKTPIKRFSGAHEATTDADLIKEWWGIVPNANVGIATGHRSRLHVIDVDAADSPVMEWLPMTLITHTPNGGHHYLYEVSENDRFPNGSKHDANALAPDCDMRGERGHIVAPPSIVVPRGGVIAVAYRWLTGPFCSNPFMRDITLAPLPQRIRDKFTPETSGRDGA